MNVLNCQYKTLAYMNFRNRAWYEQDYGLHASKTQNLIRLQTNHRLEHGMVQIMETLETNVSFLNFHTLKKCNRIHNLNQFNQTALFLDNCKTMKN